MRSVVVAKANEVWSTLGMSVESARMVVWNAYCAAVQGERSSPLFSDFQDLIEVISEEELPLFLVHKSIGCDIHRGKTEEQARQAVVDWLKEDPQNGIFGNYRLTPEFVVLKT